MARLKGERERYLAAHGDRLLQELEAACNEAVAELRSAADALIVADQRWHHTAGQVAGYLRGMNLSPTGNQPSEHGLEPAIRDLKHVTDIRSPAPHWRRRVATEHEQRRVEQLISERNERNENEWIEAA